MVSVFAERSTFWMPKEATHMTIALSTLVLFFCWWGAVAVAYDIRPQLVTGIGVITYVGGLLSGLTALPTGTLSYSFWSPWNSSVNGVNPDAWLWMLGGALSAAVTGAMFRRIRSWVNEHRVRTLAQLVVQSGRLPVRRLTRQPKTGFRDGRNGAQPYLPRQRT